jgi:NAD(P)H-flavin reductase
MIARGPDPLVPAPLAIARVSRETHDTVTLRFDAPPGAGFRFRPGQFNMLYVFGVGEVAISMSGDAAQPERLLHTIRAVGTVTNAIAALKRGSSLGVRGPFGSGWPLDEARDRDVLIVAGGLGLAPLRPAIYHLVHNRKDYRRVAILYGARTPEDLLYRKELARWRGLFDVVVEVTVDRATPSWLGPVGVVPALIAKLELDSSRAVALLCGPEVMMRFAVRDLERRGIAHERIYVSMERSMRCGVGFCGHCQYGPSFICKDGPVLRYDRIANLLHRREI